jgi:hypothetical protein
MHLFNLNLYGQALSKITSTGVMTYSFIQAIERGHGTTYGSVLNAMRATIRKTTNEHGGGIVTTLISMLLAGGNFSGGITQVCFFIINFLLFVFRRYHHCKSCGDINFLIMFVCMCSYITFINSALIF